VELRFKKPSERTRSMMLEAAINTDYASKRGTESVHRKVK